jgi:hypothetical protein
MSVLGSGRRGVCGLGGEGGRKLVVLCLVWGEVVLRGWGQGFWAGL